MGLHRLPIAPVLSMTPRQIYEEIKVIAKARFQHSLSDQKKLNCLKNVNNKTSLLRDICLIIGLKLSVSESRAFVLSNNIKAVLQVWSKREETSQNSKKKKTNAPVALIDEATILSNYKYLPFQVEDISSMVPVVKQVHVINKDAVSLMTEAKQAYMESSLDKAFDLY